MTETPGTYEITNVEPVAAALLPVAEYQENSLSFNHPPTWEEAETVVNTLLRMDGAIQWWWGDTLLILDATFGEEYTQLFPDGYAAKSLANMRWVASRIPPARRREVSWSHHEAVTPLEEQVQDELLQMAVDEQWTVRQIRAAARAAQGKLPAPKEDKNQIIQELKTQVQALREILEAIRDNDINDADAALQYTVEVAVRALEEI